MLPSGRLGPQSSHFQPAGPGRLYWEGITLSAGGFLLLARITASVFRRRPTPSAGAQRASFEQEALSLLDRLYATALRLTRNDADAQDLVQETYLRAFRSAAQFAPGTNLRAWLFTILHNAHLNERRDRGRSPVEANSEVVEQAPDPPDRSPTPEQILLGTTMDVDLRAALDLLPATFREAVWLRDVEQFSYADIARIVGVPIGTVMSRISRGRRLLHDDLLARSDRFGHRPAPTGGDRSV